LNITHESILLEVYRYAQENADGPPVFSAALVRILMSQRWQAKPHRRHVAHARSTTILLCSLSAMKAAIDFERLSLALPM